MSAANKPAFLQLPWQHHYQGGMSAATTSGEQMVDVAQ